MVTHHDKYMDYDSLGWKERLTHVEYLKTGAPCYFIMCQVKNPNTSPREIANFDAKTVFVGGSWEEYENDIWVELVARVPAESFAP